MPESTIEKFDVPVVDLTQPLEMGDAENAFLARLADKSDEDASKKKPSDEGETKTKEQPAEEAETKPEAEETPAEGEETETEGEAEADKKYAEDDVFFKVKVGDEEHEVSSAELKRLYGQEKALTRKSQEVAEVRKTAEAELAKATTALGLLLQRAQERAQPYKNINFLVAAKELGADELKALTDTANAAFEEERFLQNELSQFMGAIQQKQADTHREQVKTALKELTDNSSKSYIDGWGDKVYDEIRAFGVDMGLPSEMVNTISMAPAIKMMHMAMLYQKGQQAVKTVKPVNKSAPKKIVKNTKSPAPVQPSKAKVDKAMEKLARTGHQDDAAAAFLARMTAESDD